MLVIHDNHICFTDITTIILLILKETFHANQLMAENPTWQSGTSWLCTIEVRLTNNSLQNPEFKVLERLEGLNPEFRNT